MRNRVLATGRPAETTALDAAVMTTAQGGTTAPTIAIHRPSGRSALALTIMPPDHPAARTFGGVAAVVFVTDLSDVPANAAATLKAVYGLTAMESRVAEALGTDVAPSEIAERNGVSIQTIRSQIRAIMVKMGVSRSTEIARQAASVHFRTRRE